MKCLYIIDNTSAGIAEVHVTTSQVSSSTSMPNYCSISLYM